MIEQQKHTEVRSESGSKYSPCFFPVVSNTPLACDNVALGQGHRETSPKVHPGDLGGFKCAHTVLKIPQEALATNAEDATPL